MVPWRHGGVVQDSDEEEELTLQLESQQSKIDRSRRHSPARKDVTPEITSLLSDIVMARRTPLVADHPFHADHSQPIYLSQPCQQVDQSGGKPDSRALQSSFPPSAHRAPQKASSPDVTTRKSPVHQPPVSRDSAGRSQLVQPHAQEQSVAERDIFDIPSSPLSEPPESHAGSRSLSPAMPTEEDASHRHMLAEPAPHFIERSGRTFRKRNPIQVHPYLLENEMYRTALRSRGLRPLHVAATPPREETQHPDSLVRNHTSSQTQPSSPYMASSSPPPRIASPPSSITSADELGEFPDLAALSRIEAPGERRVGFKKRKTNPIEPAVSDTAIHALGGDSEMLGDANSKAVSLKGKRHYKKKFRFPPGFELPDPTPAAPSSETGRQPREIPRNFEQSSNESASDVEARGRKRHLTRASSVQSETLSDASDPPKSPDLDRNESLKRIQRRMRGVLPASWMKLDMRAKEIPSTVRGRDQTTLRSPEKSIRGKGVARKVHKSSVNPPVHSPLESKAVHAIEFPEESEDDDLQQPLSDRASTRNDIHGGFSLPVFDEDSDTASIVEEDFIDPMLQAPSRPRQAPQAPRKRQTRLTESPRLSRKTSMPQHPRQSSRQTRGSGMSGPRPARPQHRKAWLHPQDPPQMSIIDVASSNERPPSFVTVAKRQARRRLDQGRHSPTRKLISLQTQQDGADVDEVIRDWQQGRMKPSKTRPTQRAKFRVPLAGTTDNGQLPAPFESKETDGRKPKASTGRNRPSRSAEKSRTQPKLRAVPIVVLDAAENPLEHTSGPALAEKRSQAQILPSRRAPVLKRLGQLEELESEHDQANKRSNFHRNLQQLNREHIDQNAAHTAGERRVSGYLADARGEADKPDAAVSHAVSVEHSRQLTPGKQRPKKRKPQRVDLRQIEHHEPWRADPVDYLPPSSTSKTGVGFENDLQGLGSYGTAYTTDFGIAPLPIGVCFRESTFLGSGGLSEALGMHERDLDVASSMVSLSFGESFVSLGPWTEDSMSTMCDIRNFIATPVCSLEESAPPMTAISFLLRRVVYYIANGLSFLDPIDRRSFTAALLDFMTTVMDSFANRRGLELQPLTYMFVIALQVQKIAQHPAVTQLKRSDLLSNLESIEVKLTSEILKRDAELKSFHRRDITRHVREYGIREIDTALEALVVLYQGLRWLREPRLSFWTAIGDALGAKIPPNCSDISLFETAWHTIFAVLPLLEIGSDGMLHPESRNDPQNVTMEDCSIVKELFKQTVGLQQKHPSAPTMNAYVRAILVRCLRLTRIWSWRKIEPVMSAAFDFFARSGLHMLQNEESRGSCKFLESLDSGQLPAVDNSDNSFHIFLKLLATGLNRLREVYADKKMKNIVWRFMPNHGRTHSKEDTFKREDLDALRNHHDLLTVLYCASPVGSKPNLLLFQQLVDFRLSHAEACLLNVQTWTNLARHELSFQEKGGNIEAFAAWMNEMISGSLQQHRLAKTEAEAYMQSRLAAGHIVSKNVVESTVVANQRQVEAVLQAIAGALRTVMANSANVSAAELLFENISLGPIFAVVNEKTSTSCKTVIEALAAYEAFLCVTNRNNTNVDSQPRNEESQEYGEWPSDDESSHDGLDMVPHNNAAEKASDDLQALLSNVCGADYFPDEGLIAKCVDLTVCAGAILIKKRHRDWSYYLEPHGRGSWQQLRDTDQTRKFKPYFFASVLGRDPHSFEEHRTAIVSDWLVSLVERESALKFQHRLTSALLNLDCRDPLRHNLPFARSISTQRYEVNLEQLRDRRLSLISCVLSNIRRSYDMAAPALKSNANRDEYVTIIRRLMTAMKQNYQELDVGSSTRGSYIQFVQTVVQSLQQHTADICPIDRYFTDSSAFPLPTEDPLYVIGRLKAYQLKARDRAAQKQLAIFVQTTCERAAAEHQQDYLIDQLTKAVDGVADESASPDPSLRNVLLGAIFPAYVEAAGSTPTACLLANPILAAAQDMLAHALFAMDLADGTALRAASASALAILHAALTAASHPAERLPAMQRPEHAATLAGLLHTIAASLPLLAFLARSDILTRADARPALTHFRALAAALLDQSPPPDVPESSGSSNFSDASAFARQELLTTLARSWSRDATGAFWVVRAGARRRVTPDVGTLDEERAGAVVAAGAYLCVLERMPVLDAWSRRAGESRLPQPNERTRGNVVDVFV